MSENGANACRPEAATCSERSGGARRSLRGERKGLPQGDQPREAGERKKEPPAGAAERGRGSGVDGMKIGWRRVGKERERDEVC